MSDVRWQCFDDSEAVATETVRRVLDAARRAVAARGVFRLVLAGGSTPLLAYRKLAECDADWSRWHVYPGDERCLEPQNEARNSRAITDAWLGCVPIPAGQVHWMPGEEGAEQGAHTYAGVVEEALPFDLVLLGMGEDGHTASLFPGHDHDMQALVVAVHDAPKPPPERISLNYPALNTAREMLVVVTGGGKREVVGRWQNGERFPVSALCSEAGVDVLLDSEACPD